MKNLLYSSIFLTVCGVHVLYAQEELVDDSMVSSQRTTTEVRSIIPSQDDMPDFLYEQNLEVMRKREQVQMLIKKGVDTFGRYPFSEALNRITHSSELIKGELFLFMLDTEGTVWGHRDASMLWKNIYDLQDDFGYYFVRELIKKALNGGGWFSYRWRNVTKTSYVTLVEKDGKQFVLAAGYYPIFKAESVVSLVRGAVSLFTTFKEQGLDKEAAFGAFMYPMGRFVYSNLYLTVYDESGIILSDGERATMLGVSTWNRQDEDGVYVTREIIQQLKDKPVGRGFWVQHRSKNTLKNRYAERVVDRQGHSYYIVSGFFPGEDRQKVVELVSKGYRYLKTYGKTAAREAFQVYPSGNGEKKDVTRDFVFGNLNLFVIDFDAKVLISGLSPDIVGFDYYDLQDATGLYVFREIINRLKKDDRVWVDFTTKSAFVSIYAERVDVGLEQLIIACSFYPSSKPEMMQLMVEAAGSYMKVHPEQDAFAAFSSMQRGYIRGELEIFVMNPDGRCYVWGDNTDYIWRDLFRLKNSEGRFFMKELVNLSSSRAGQLGVKQNNAFKVYYAETIEKDDKRYVIGSGYYP